jgi:hypothetical protein
MDLLAVLGLAVGETGESPEPPPVRRARIGIVASGKRLCDESSNELWKDIGVLQLRSRRRIVAGFQVDETEKVSSTVCCQDRGWLWDRVGSDRLGCLRCRVCFFASTENRSRRHRRLSFPILPTRLIKY